MFGKFKKNELLAWKILQISISFLYKTKNEYLRKRKLNISIIKMRRIDSLTQAQTRAYSYSYTFLFEFVLKLASIAVRQYG